jgi:hypothetical protein
MTQEQIHASLDKMLADAKSRNFLNHLVRAYMPITNVEKVWDKPKEEIKCSISRDKLISVQEILEGINTEEFKNDTMAYLKNLFDEKADRTTPIAKLVGEKKLGVTGKDTTTFMSYPVFQEFYNWVITKSLKGDKHINWLIGSIRRSEFIERAEKINDSAVQDKVSNFKKHNNKSKSATFTLADSNDVLAQLKSKLESEGK